VSTTERPTSSKVRSQVRTSFLSLARHASFARRQARLGRRREVNQVLKFLDSLASLRRDEKGQTMAEYGVVLAIITLTVVGAFGILSGNIEAAVEEVAGYLT
jgi:Flp pilus assembly pilin Flp